MGCSQLLPAYPPITQLSPSLTQIPGNCTCHLCAVRLQLPTLAPLKLEVWRWKFSRREIYFESYSFAKGISRPLNKKGLVQMPEKEHCILRYIWSEPFHS